MLKRLVLGAAAGAIATVPQSAVVWGFKQAGVYKGAPAPEVISAAVTKRTTGQLPEDDQKFKPMMLAQHFGIGATFGALYGLLNLVVSPGTVAGPLAGLLIWKGNYDGLLPAMGIFPKPEHDEQGRTVTMVTAHIAYGFALGTVFNRFMGRGWLE